MEERHCSGSSTDTRIPNEVVIPDVGESHASSLEIHDHMEESSPGWEAVQCLVVPDHYASGLSQSDEQLNAETQILEDSIQDGKAYETKEQVLDSPLKLEWCLGVNCSVRIHCLNDGQRQAVVYACGQVAVIYNIESNTQQLLQGFKNDVSSLATSSNKRYVAVADAGPESTLKIWDSHSGSLLQSLSLQHLEGGILAMDMSPDGKLIVTLSAGPSQRICIWDCIGNTHEPLCSLDIDKNYGKQTHVAFNPDDIHEVMSNSEKQVIFYDWTDLGIDISTPFLHKMVMGRPVGLLSQSAFQPGFPRAVTASSAGELLLWELSRKEKGQKGSRPHTTYNVKILRLQEKAIGMLRVTTKYIVTGDVQGHICFYDHKPSLLYWYSSLALGPITSLSFSAAPAEPSLEIKCPQDASLEGKPFIARDFMLATKDAVVAMVTPRNGHMSTVVRGDESAVSVVCAHPVSPLLAVGSRTGRLRLWDFEHRRCVDTREFSRSEQIHCLTYNSKGSELAVGFTDGSVRILECAQLQDVLEQPFRYAHGAITKLTFSADSHFLASAEEGFVVTVFFCGNIGKIEASNWELLGRYKSHHKPIQDLLFWTDPEFGQPHLFSLGLDRMLVEYDLAGSSHGDLCLAGLYNIEQSAEPHAACWYPDLGPETFFLTANNEHKFRLYNPTNKMCRYTFLAPLCESPINRLILVPPQAGFVGPSCMAFCTRNKVGVHLLPLDGNVHRAATVPCHPRGIARLCCANDGRHLVTSGELDAAIFIWRINTTTLQAAAALAGPGLDPFYTLLEGGREGDLFKEMEELFYLMQLRSEGYDTMDPRQIDVHVPLGQVPTIMRALGFYLTRRQVEEITNEVRFGSYAETGNYRDRVDLPTLLRLYLNHRPVLGLRSSCLHDAFATLSRGNGPRVPEQEGLDRCAAIPQEEFLRLQLAEGEKMTEEELIECITSLLLLPEAQSLPQLAQLLPAEITTNNFVQDILSFPAILESEHH
uniref:cilia- and flagella-associated protein 251 n=1 Tax=Myxine glutinosa TaxID=7769 RepID=UPI00358FC891